MENDGGWDLSMPRYCPDYRPTDILKGNYFTEKYSWLRLAVHRCDPKEMIQEYIGGEVNLQNKKCASREE